MVSYSIHDVEIFLVKQQFLLNIYTIFGVQKNTKLTKLNDLILLFSACPPPSFDTLHLNHHLGASDNLYRVKRSLFAVFNSVFDNLVVTLGICSALCAPPVNAALHCELDACRYKPPVFSFTGFFSALFTLIPNIFC